MAFNLIMESLNSICTFFDVIFVNLAGLPLFINKNWGFSFLEDWFDESVFTSS